MAVAGSMTTAYVVEVKPMQTTFPSDRCATPADAVAAVRRGERATVQGSDMPEFWQELRFDKLGRLQGVTEVAVERCVILERALNTIIASVDDGMLLINGSPKDPITQEFSKVLEQLRKYLNDKQPEGESE